MRGQDTWRLYDLINEIVCIYEEDIPTAIIQFVGIEVERGGSTRVLHVALDFNASRQVAVLAQRLHQVWRAQP